MPASSPQVMLFGTYHMAHPNPDAIKTDHPDVRSGDASIRFRKSSAD